MKPAMDTMNATERKRIRSLNQERSLLAIFICVAVIAVASFAFISFRERNRIRLTAEYQAYQFATQLLQEYQSNPGIDFGTIDGLVGFGVYSNSGEAIFRTAMSPMIVRESDTIEHVRIIENKVRLILRIGGGMSLRDGRMRNPDPFTHAMGTPPQSTRYIYIEYAAPALALGQSIIFFLGVVAVLTMILAFVIIVRMFRRLESYKAEEAKNRELISMGEAARTLAHEIKNPLGIIMMRCALVKRNASLETVTEIIGIENETNRIAALIDNIREFMLSGKDSDKQTGNEE